MLCFCLFCTQAYCKTEWKAKHPVIAACLVQLHKNGLQLKNLNSITTQLWEGSSWHAMCQEATLLWTSWRRLAPRQWHPGANTSLSRPEHRLAHERDSNSLDQTDFVLWKNIHKHQCYMVKHRKSYSFPQEAAFELSFRGKNKDMLSGPAMWHLTCVLVY